MTVSFKGIWDDEYDKQIEQIKKESIKYEI